MKTLKILMIIAAATSISLTSCSQLPGGKQSWTELLNQGNEAQRKQDAQGAEKMYQAAIQAAVDKFGPDDVRTATCLGYLAGLYASQQEWRKAAKVYKTLLMIKEKLDPKSQEYLKLKKEYAFVRKKLRKYGLEEDKEPLSLKPGSGTGR